MHVRVLAAGLAMAGSALAGTIPGTLPVEPTKIIATTFLDLYTHAPIKGPQPTSACPSCDVPHPKEWDPNWEKDAVLNDTTKHHKSFKLFAYPRGADSDMKLPVHIRQHPDHKNVWSIKAAIDSEGRMDEHQPKWNLHNKGLETDGSAPIKDKLYFRLWEPKISTHNPQHYREMLTKDKGQKKYKQENNSKLVGRKSWSLVRDDKNPAAYELVGADPAGKFFFCVDLKTVKSLKSLAGESTDPFHKDNPFHGKLDDKDKVHLFKAMEKLLVDGLGDLVYSNDKPNFESGFGEEGLLLDHKGVAQICTPSVLKVRDFHHTSHSLIVDS